MTVADDTADGRDADDTDGGRDADAEPPEAVELSSAVADGPVLLFDGVCNLCNGAVQFVVDRDDAGRIRFASLQSDLGRVVRDRLDLPADDLETVVLLEGTRAYTKSAAVIRVAELLGGVYSVAGVGWLLPRRLRDRLYDLVAANRYDWFGRREQCMVPTPELESRFLE